eukprot:8723756-Pyramimonas_sp.AAC.1
MDVSGHEVEAGLRKDDEVMHNLVANKVMSQADSQLHQAMAKVSPRTNRMEYSRALSFYWSPAWNTLSRRRSIGR